MAAKKKPQRFLSEERFAFTGGTVDRTDPNHPKVIGVLLCGQESGNTFVGIGKDRMDVKGRRYLPKAFAGKRVERYNGALVFLNHPGKPTDHRIYQEKLAVVENARHRADGMPLGDFAVNPKSIHADQFLWDCENAPNSCGASHRAYCDWKMSSDGFAEAVELQEVLSVDVVIGPATTGGIFEHKEQTMSTLKEVAEWVIRNPKSTTEQIIKIKDWAATHGELVMEEMGEGDEPGGAIDEAFKTLMSAHLDELLGGTTTIEDFCKKAKAFHKAHMGGKKEGEEGGEEKKKEEGSMESKQIGYDKAISLCQEAKFNATASEYKLLAKCETDAEVKAFIQEQTAKGSEKPPRSTGRTVATPPKQPVQEQSSFKSRFLSKHLS